MSIGSSSGENRGREQDLWSLSDECTRTIRNAPMCPSSNSGVAFKKTDRSKAGRPHLRRNAPGATAASGSKGALKDMERCEIKRRTAAPPTTIFLINPCPRHVNWAKNAPTRGSGRSTEEKAAPAAHTYRPARCARKKMERNEPTFRYALLKFRLARRENIPSASSGAAR